MTNLSDPQLIAILLGGLACSIVGIILAYWASLRRNECVAKGRGINAALFYCLMLAGFFIFVVGGTAILASAVEVNNHSKKAQLRIMDRLIAGESVPISQYRDILGIGIDSMTDEWCKEQNIPQKRREVITKIISDEILAAKVQLNLPDDIAAIAKSAIAAKK